MEETGRIDTQMIINEASGGCCESESGLQIMESIPAKISDETPCCGGDSKQTAFPTASNEGDSIMPSAEKRTTAFWVWGLAGLVGITTIVFSAGMVPGLKRGDFWHHLFLNLTFVGKNVWSILPFFLLSVAVSAWVTVSGLAERIKAVFNRREHIAVAGAAIVGAVIPLCSCGVIPLIAAMLSSGVPLGPVMAFWVSSPLMDPSMFVLTAGVLGMDYAIARLVTAVVLGAGAGYIITFLASSGMLNNQLQGLSLQKSSCCDADKDLNDRLSRSRVWKAFWPQAWSVTLFIGKWLLVAFFLESLIVHYVDSNWISSVLGNDRFFSIPLATAIGIPVYTSGVGAIPIVKGLLNNGMSHGAALAFLVAGPVTTIPAMTAVFALVKRQTFAIYLCVGIGGSLIAGYVYQTIMG